MLAYASFGFLIAHAPADFPRLDEAPLDAPVLLFALGITITTGFLCGLLPALHYAHTDPQEDLKIASSAVNEGRRGQTVRSTLVSLEVALSTVCLVALGLLLHSFIQLMRVNRGFDIERVLTVNLSLPVPQYGEIAQRTEFWKRLLTKVETLPSVISVGISNRLPLTGTGTDNDLIPEGQHLPMSERPVADMRFVNPEFFRTLRIPLETGRIFSLLDQDHRVAVISATTARRLYGYADSIGKRFHLGAEENPLITIVGIVGDVRGNGLQRAPKFTIYLPYWQRDRLEMALAVRTTLDPLNVAAAVRQQIRSVDPELPVPQFRTMADVLDASVAQRRFQLFILAIFGGLAALLASLGIYGVVSYAVAQRKTEMGVRLALGAQPKDVGWLVLRQGLAPVARGLLAGILLALLSAQWIGSLLFGVSGRDPLTLCAVTALFAAVAILACWLPMVRTMRIDPIQALRYE